ncbi:MAG: tRNA (guanosine(46)-N7)-methyltransferase TrmB [Propionibacteriaceae bacterium]
MAGGGQPMRTGDRGRREVVSFVRRSARLSPAQRKSWDAHHEKWVLDVPRRDSDTSIAPGFSLDLTEAFGRAAPLIVEIGPGMGESLSPMAAVRSGANVLAFEVYHPAVARILAKLARDSVENVRVVEANAVEGLSALLPEASIDRLWMFFPDPWHKKRHRKRRLLTPAFADLAASRVKPGGLWRLATDWEDYASQMRDVLDEHPDFENLSPGGWAPRWDKRPVTKFEQRGIDAGRHIFDLSYRRR